MIRRTAMRTSAAEISLRPCAKGPLRRRQPLREPTLSSASHDPSVDLHGTHTLVPGQDDNGRAKAREHSPTQMTVSRLVHVTRRQKTDFMIVIPCEA